MRTSLKIQALPCVLLFFILLSGCTSNSQEATNPSSSDPLFNKYDLGKIQLPQGFHIAVYAEVKNARSLCWGDKGTLFVGNREGNSVSAVVDENNDGKADKVYTVARNLNTPNGVAFRNGSLYIAEISRILKIDNIESNLDNPPAYSVVYDKFPTDGHHGWKFIAFGPDGKLYVPVGAPCNVCKMDNPVYSTITRMNPDGTGFEIYASGIRNSVGFTWHPTTGALWFTENGRDNLGDDVPADELNMANKAGMNFGFPYCHQGDIADPEFGKQHPCSDFTPPQVKLAPHAAALGLRFYTGNMFPESYKNNLIIAEHGSWNRSTPIGYRLTLVKFNGNNKPEYSPFATGWLDNAGKVSGRPVDVLLAKDGSLLVSDDLKGAVYRVYYDGK